MSAAGIRIFESLPWLAVLSLGGAMAWLAGYWIWRLLSKAFAILIIRFPLALLSWVSKVGSGAGQLRHLIMSSATFLDGDAARETIRWPGIVAGIYAHALRRLDKVERPDSVTQKIFRREEMVREIERGRENILPSFWEDKALIELVLGGKDSLRAFLTLRGAGQLDIRARAAAVALLAKSGDLEKMEVAAYHLNDLLKPCEGGESLAARLLSESERNELIKIQKELSRKFG